MWLFVWAAFCTLFSHVVPETFTVSTSEGLVSVRLGRVANIPCWLTPSQNAEGLEVRWYRPNFFDSPVLLYLERQIQESSQLPQYAGRTSLGLREAKSEGLKEGDVTLKLVNVTLKDQGPYICYVSSDQSYESATVSLTVNVLGSPPLLSAVRTENGSVNVSCMSHGWQPRPRLKWSDGTRTLQPGSTRFGGGAQDLESIHSWLLTNSTSSPWVSCSLSLPEGDEWEGRVDLQNLPEVQANSSGSLLTAVIILILLLVIAAVVIGVLYRKRDLPEEGTKTENTQLLSSTENMEGSLKTEDLEAMRQAGVDVSLDHQTAPACLTVSANGKTVRDRNNYVFAPGEQCYILGKPGFIPGRCAYWEVGLGDDKVGIKESWWVGVACGSFSRQEEVKPCNGFWFLSLDRENGLRLNMTPDIKLPALPRPQTLGVYLDYDKGELSFISVEDMRRIVTVATVFTGEVFPLFNPGIGDRAPMRILDVVTQNECLNVPDMIEDPKSTTPTMNTFPPDSKHPNNETSKTNHSTVP
ncbi:butyrophilin subfamily 1 member A1 isoform X3 [Esox lucius]|uniref:butyrophilin subfamily 1 member A1 isoform X3 n=1 Tax=Esox lucius TaxID=8010 RepID=UPI001476B27B|nr:butyrophilin subfamily 1 member A1 isoform X3 [Esox lucius]XP_034146599.1 butyrophilin subfamily 1 member A1 isoform X3 [Esox lucius]